MSEKATVEFDGKQYKRYCQSTNSYVIVEVNAAVDDIHKSDIENVNSEVNISTRQNMPEEMKEISELTIVNYRHFHIRIFTDITEKSHPKRFYFEPLVLLDQNSIASESHSFFKQDVVRLTIQMWNPQVRSKVLDRLRSLPELRNFEIQEDDILVMPFREIQMVINNHQSSIKVMDHPTPYYPRMNESLDFYLLCDSTSSAQDLAENFRRYPEFVLKKFQLALECRGLRQKFKFNVSTLPPISQSQAGEMKSPFPRLTELESQVLALINRKSSTSAIPIFSARNCLNPASSKGTSFAYSSLDFDTKEEHGEFDQSSGIFTVKTPGFYQFNFAGHVFVDGRNFVHQFLLKVDNIIKAVSYTHFSSIKTSAHLPVNLSSLVPLKSGEKVGVFVGYAGKLYEAPPTYVTRFCGILVAADERRPT